MGPCDLCWFGTCIPSNVENAESTSSSGQQSVGGSCPTGLADIADTASKGYPPQVMSESSPSSLPFFDPEVVARHAEDPV